METVEKFLQLRRDGKSEEAASMLAPNASLGAPWGGMKHGDKAVQYLRDEPTFVHKGYLDPVPIKKIDDRTFQREFQWDRGVFEAGNAGMLQFRLPKWREMYFVTSDGKIRLVVANKQPRELNLFRSFFGCSS